MRRKAAILTSPASFSGRKEMPKLTSTASFKSFRYIRHDRNRRSANLVSQAVVSAEGAVSCDFVNFFCQFSGRLPGTYFLKRFESSHGYTPRDGKDDKAYGECLEDLKPETWNLKLETRFVG